MQTMFLNTLQRSGQMYHVERDGSIMSNYKGLSNHEDGTHKAYIGFVPGTDIKSNDWVINSQNERFWIKDTQTAYFQGEPHQLKCYYLTEVEYKNLNNKHEATFNIQNAYGSVIGTQSYVNLNYNDSIKQLDDQIERTDSADKPELKQLVSLLEMIVNNQVPASKGILSKFSDVMERNSWITGSIASALLNWLTTQIH